MSQTSVNPSKESHPFFDSTTYTLKDVKMVNLIYIDFYQRYKLSDTLFNGKDPITFPVIARNLKIVESNTIFIETDRKNKILCIQHI